MHTLGYVHASERLWQMDLLRRAGAGELSELLGADMVENDQYLRSLGMREAAVRTAAAFEADAPAEIQEAMGAYLSGINAFIALDKRPFEYQLLGEDPRPFNTQDVYCATGFMAYSFAIHLKTEPMFMGMTWRWVKTVSLKFPRRLIRHGCSAMLPDCHHGLRDWMSFDLCLSGWVPTLGSSAGSARLPGRYFFATMHIWRMLLLRSGTKRTL
jgi:hypothetical protein